VGRIIVSEGVLGPQGDIRSLCFQLVTDPKTPVTAGGRFLAAVFASPFSITKCFPTDAWANIGWSQNGHNKSATLTSYAIDG